MSDIRPQGLVCESCFAPRKSFNLCPYKSGPFPDASAEAVQPKVIKESLSEIYRNNVIAINILYICSEVIGEHATKSQLAREIGGLACSRCPEKMLAT